jgi:hypothetical protein
MVVHRANKTICVHTLQSYYLLFLDYCTGIQTLRPEATPKNHQEVHGKLTDHLNVDERYSLRKRKLPTYRAGEIDASGNSVKTPSSRTRQKKDIDWVEVKTCEA